MKNSPYYIVIILIVVVFGGCEAAERQHKPDNTFHTDDLIFAVAPNFLADATPLTEFLLDHELQIDDLTDLVMEKNAAHSVLLLFRSGQVVRLSEKGVPSMVINARGQGPGELLLPYTLKIRNDDLFILDRNQSKISKYRRDGGFVKDIVLQMGLTEDFEILDDGTIVIVNSIPQRFEGSLFTLYNQYGTYINGFGDNSILQPILQATENIPRFKVSKSPKNELVLTSVLRGRSFIYALNSEEEMAQFSIQQGPEWEDIDQYEKNNPNLGYVDKVKNIDFFPNGNIMISWGGPFKGTKSVCMIYDKRGVFLKRVFKNKDLQFEPSLISIENDSTVWLYHSGAYLLTRTYLRPYEH